MPYPTSLASYSATTLFPCPCSTPPHPTLPRPPQAIGQGSSEEHQVRAWRAVTPLVQQLREFYEFSTELEESVLHLLAALTSADLAPSQHLETQQALTKQFAEILHFTLSFDDLKVGRSCCMHTRGERERESTPHVCMHTHTCAHTHIHTYTHHTCKVCEGQQCSLVCQFRTELY